MKQKIRKTPTSRRDAYKYYDAEGQLVITLRPNAASQVTDIHIKFLHSLDDAEVYNNHKNCASGMVDHKMADMELSIGLRKKSQWVLSLNRLTDEANGAYRENTRLLEEAYRNEEEQRRDVRKELLYEAVSYDSVGDCKAGGRVCTSDPKAAHETGKVVEGNCLQKNFVEWLIFDGNPLPVN